MGHFSDHFRTIENYWTAPDWLGARMLFLSGPRQVGKTTLVTSTLCPHKETYFNWDNRKVREAFRKDSEFFAGTPGTWICFDEIHKRPKWKDILKGIYDTHKNNYRFVVTGSARLDTFKKSGDSLVGRYFHTQLFPINLPDLNKTDFKEPTNAWDLLRQAGDAADANGMEDLLILGGFPEPFFNGKESFWKRWSANHRDLILSEDLRDISRVTEVDRVAALLDLLEPAIGSTVSYLNLGRDLESGHTNIKRWLDMLQKLQLVFSISPYSKNIRRAFKQEKKWYFTDWRGATSNVFENYVAASLYRAATLYTDRYGDKMTLHFVRTHDGTEVDFLLCKNKNPWLLVEAKQGSPEITRGVYRFSEELHAPCAVVTRKPGIYQKIKGPTGQKIVRVSWSKLGRLLA